MQNPKSQVMQPVTMAVLIAVSILFELPSFSARTNSSSRSAIHRNLFSPSLAETMGNTDEHLPSNFVNIPVFGDVYPNRFYYVKIKIGNNLPNRYNLDIDTGSDLTWLPKEFYPLYESQTIPYVRCDEPLCTDVHESTSGKCKNTDPCDYKISYHEGSSSEGFLVTDSFTLHLEDGSLISHTLAIGCGTFYSSKEPNSQSTTHGMLGLGKGRLSILSQLHEQGHFANIFGHCLSSNSGGDLMQSGFMFIGKGFDYPRCLTWVPMSSDVSNYSLTGAKVVYGDHEQSLLEGNQVFVFDSGTTDTFFVESLYQQLLTKIAETPLQKVLGDENYPDCWKDTRPITDLRNRFSSLYLKSRNGPTLEIPPENYLIIMEDGDACLTILNGSAYGLYNFNLIGAISMQNVMVVYHNEQHKIGWAPVTGCTQPLNCPPYMEHIETPRNYGNFANKKFHNHLLLLLVLLLLETINEILLV